MLGHSVRNSQQSIGGKQVTEKPEPVKAWGLYRDAKLIDIVLTVAASARLTALYPFDSVIPVTITAKDTTP